MIRALLLVLAGALLAGCGSRESTGLAAGGDPSVAATLSTNRLLVGDAVDLTIRVENPGDSRVDWPEFDNPPGVVVRGIVSESTTPALAEKTWRVTSLRPGIHSVVTGSIELVRGGEVATRLTLPMLTWETMSLLEGTNAQPREYKALAEWPASRRIWWILLALAIVTLLAIAAALVARRFLKPASGAPPPPPEPPHLVALRALEELAGPQWLNDEKVEPFYVRVSLVIRTYLEDRFGLRAPERTTEEFIRDASSSRDLNADQQNLVGSFLTESDLVKFAKFRPQVPDMERALGAAKKLVVETAPPPPSTGGKP